MDKWLVKSIDNSELNKAKPHTSETITDTRSTRTDESDDGDAEEEHAPAPKLPRKVKSVQRLNKFCQSWLTIPEFKGWLQKSTSTRGGHEYAFCRLCHCDISAHKNDIKRHSTSEKHVSNNRQVMQNKKVSEMPFLQVDDSVKRAEIKLCGLLAVNNLPFLLMDTLSPLCSNLFPDSKIASKLAVRRTKATGIMKNCLGEVFKNELAEILRIPGNFFSIIMDETTDMSTKKQCAFTVIYFCKEKEEVVTRFFDMKETNGDTALDLYNCLESVILEKNIPLKNLVGYSSDTTNVMFGDNQSVSTLLRDKLPHIICIKCSCHLIHLAASKACLCLPRSIEDMLRNIGSHFSRSPARQRTLQEYQEFFKTKLHKILLPANTRWLSVKQCVDRTLEQYDVLVHYFREIGVTDPSKTTEDILNVLINPFTKIYLQFMSYILGLLTDFNKLFQSESPLLYRLKSETENLLQTVLLNYMKVEHITGKDPLQVNQRKPKFFCALEDIYLGIEATDTLIEFKSKLPKDDVSAFFKNCLNFYIELATQIKARFSFKEDIFDIIDFVDPVKAQSFSLKSLSLLKNKFPFLKDYIDFQELDNEWRRHAGMNFKQLQMDASKPAEQYWKYVLDFKNAAGMPLFKNLTIAVRFALILPFSNASVERIFSQLALIKNSHRNNLNTETVSALLYAKEGIAASNNGILEFEPCKKMLNKMK